MILKCLVGREESLAFAANELANTTVLQDLVSEPIMLPRKIFRTSIEGTRQPHFLLGYVRLGVNFKRIFAGEKAIAPGVQAREGSLWVAMLGSRGSSNCCRPLFMRPTR